ncbi:hypothetical protein ACLI07_22415 (plasmid) [Providencia huaxiensis]|uniref:Uncharacterized protein n=1 Tax=Providencia huashanensis TaxID=3037798 RepID=A0ABT9AZK9_9GAMM|nr:MULTISPECIES: hypothetical protein [Morganellaceae]MBZ3682138.1 hypothetical protein [Providencia rettgeri]MCU9564529.1 hypothetical protein [Proteus mirabilis]MDO7831527.1 hypothetical protein [Providencia sp. CRE-138-0026]MDO7858757.1 hypothetical protein [Providencia sp. CRE-138-0111]UII02327.1 hypothetical protein [Providencia rettgeri]
MWQIELESIIKKLDSDYEIAKEETLCCSGAAYCAFEANTETFKYAIGFIERFFSNSKFFTYILTSYENQEIINQYISNDESKDISFVIKGADIYNNCNCLRSHRNIISLSFINEHKEKTKWKCHHGGSYASWLSGAHERIDVATYNLQQIKLIKNKLELFDFIEKRYYYPNETSSVNDNKITQHKDNYKYYHILDSIIKQFNRDKPNDLTERNVDIESISQEYNANGVKLKLVDAQFARYSLLSINEFTNIENDGPFGAVFDSRINKKLQINTSPKLLNIFKELISCNFLKNLALKPMGIIDVGFGLESIERGAPLGASIKMLPSLSCFYGVIYNDKLIVSHNKEKQEITFEELRDDYNLLDDGCVVTQVIHIKYFIVKNVENTSLSI